MSNIGRIYRAGKYAKKAAAKSDMRNLVKTFPKIEVGIEDFGKILEEIDLKDPSNQAFLISDWQDEPLVYSDYNKETTAKTKWIDLGTFKISIIPILKHYKGTGIPIQLMFLGKDNLNADEQVSIFGEVNEETFAPEENRLIGNAIVSSGKLTVVRGVISKGVTKKENNKFLLLFMTSNGFIQQRIIVDFNYQPFSVTDYEEVKESRFLGLADEKHIHPRIVKKITQLLLFNVVKLSKTTGTNFIIGSSFVLAICIGLPFAISPASDLHEPWTFFIFAMIGFFALIGLYIGVIQIRSLSKAKKLKLIPDDADILEQIDLEDPLWINDFSQLSDYWFIDENASNLFEAAKMK